jgi:hypothetical protein
MFLYSRPIVCSLSGTNWKLKRNKVDSRLNKYSHTQQNKKSPINYTSGSESPLPSPLQGAQIVSSVHSFFYSVPTETNFQSTKRPSLEADRPLLSNGKLRTTKSVPLPPTHLYYLHWDKFTCTPSCRIPWQRLMVSKSINQIKHSTKKEIHTNFKNFERKYSTQG